MTFSMEQFVSKMRAIMESPHLDEDQKFDRVQVAMRESVARPEQVSAVVGQPDDAEPDTAHGVALGYDNIVFENEAVTIFTVDTLPGLLQPPHDHQIRAVIGVYEGVERNRMFSRTLQDGIDTIAPDSVKNLGPGDVLALDVDMVHAIGAGNEQMARALHVYLGSLSGIKRTLFDPETLVGNPFVYADYLDRCVAA